MNPKQGELYDARAWLRRRLAELQMGVSEFAKACGKKAAKTGGRWLLGKTTPGLDDQITIAMVVQMDVDEVLARFAFEAELVEGDMNRRDFLTGTTGFLLSPLATYANTIGGDHGYITELIEIRRALVASDAVLGPRTVMNVAVDHVKRIEGMLRSCDSAARRQIFEIGAMFCELAGWLADDLGMIDAGAHWTDRALSWSHAASSPAAIAYVLQRKAQQAVMMEDAPTAIAMASSLPAKGVPFKVRAAAEQQLAHGLALDGDDLGALSAIDRAESLLTRVGEDEPTAFSLASWCTPAYLSVQRAACLTKLGRPSDAVMAFDAALAAWPGAYRRERGLHLARKSYAMTLSGDPVGASMVGIEAANILVDVQSERTRSELRKVEHGLRGIDTCAPEVLTFRNQLTHLLQASEVNA